MKGRTLRALSARNLSATLVACPITACTSCHSIGNIQMRHTWCSNALYWSLYNRT